MSRSPSSNNAIPSHPLGRYHATSLPGSGGRSIFPFENAAAYLQLRTDSRNRGPLGRDTPLHTHTPSPFGCGFHMASSGGPCVAALLSIWSLSHLQGLFTVTKCDGQWERTNSRPRIKSHMTRGCNKHTAIPRVLNNQGLPIIHPDQPQPSRSPAKRPGLCLQRTQTRKAFAHRKVAAGLAKG